MNEASRRRFGIPKAAGKVISTFRSDADIKAHPDYAAAKGGDGMASIRLVGDMVRDVSLEEARRRFSDGVIYAPVLAEEARGKNQIPLALARQYAEATAGDVDTGIVQASRAFHTGAGAMERVISRPVFDGPVESGKRYALVDDVTVMGGTIAELANHIREGGGEVAGIVTLANAGRIEDYAPKSPHVRLIERRFGDVLRQELQIEPAALTAAEASYLAGFRDADGLRKRIAKAQGERNRRLGQKSVRPSEAEEGGRLSRARK